MIVYYDCSDSVQCWPHCHMLTLTSHCGPGGDEQPGAEEESHEVGVGEPGAGTAAHLENIVLVQLHDVGAAGYEESLAGVTAQPDLRCCGGERIM